MAYDFFVFLLSSNDLSIISNGYKVSTCLKPDIVYNLLIRTYKKYPSSLKPGIVYNLLVRTYKEYPSTYVGYAPATLHIDRLINMRAGSPTAPHT